MKNSSKFVEGTSSKGCLVFAYSALSFALIFVKQNIIFDYDKDKN